MREPDKPQAEDELVWQGLAAINRVQSQNVFPKTVDEAIEQFRKKLLTPRKPDVSSNFSLKGCIP